MSERPIAQSQVLVLGSGLAELAAAYEFARFGLSVTWLSEPDSETLIPRGAQIDPSGALAGWITSVGTPLSDDTEPACSPLRVRPGAQWVQRAGTWVRMPDDAVFGIPSSPLSTQMVQAVGTGAAFRAYLDRLTPVLTIGKSQYVGPLVSKRLGKSVLETFVEPTVRHLYGRPAAEVEVAQLAPGLNEAQGRVGSLTGAALAYGDRYLEMAGAVAPDIGWQAFSELLMHRLELHGVRRVQLDEPATVVPADASPSGDPRVEIQSGSLTFTGSVLVTREPATDARRRVEISFTHAPGVPAGAPTLHPGDEMTWMLGGDAEGWTARTSAMRDHGLVTELRSPVLNDVVVAVPELLAAAGVAELDAQDVLVITGTPLAARDEAAHERPTDIDANADAEGMVLDTSVDLSERSLSETIMRVMHDAQTLRRKLLGLS